MDAPPATVWILVIRAWIRGLGPLRDRIREVGLAPRFTRVDIEPALNAALPRGQTDAIIHDPAVTALPRSTIEALCRVHQVDVPILELTDIDAIGHQLLVALHVRRN